MDTWKLVLVKLEVKYTCIYINMEKRQGLWGTPSDSSIFNEYTKSYTFELNRGTSSETPNKFSKMSREDWQKEDTTPNNQKPNIQDKTSITEM